MIQHYVIVLPSGKELNYEHSNRGAFQRDRLDICNDAILKHGITTARGGPREIEVEIIRLSITDGKLTRTSIGMFYVTPPRAAMTSDELEEELTTAVSHLPEEFQTFVRELAFARGHSSGYEEVIAIAREVARDLGTVFAKYRLRNMVQKPSP